MPSERKQKAKECVPLRTKYWLHVSHFKTHKIRTIQISERVIIFNNLTAVREHYM